MEHNSFDNDEGTDSLSLNKCPTLNVPKSILVAKLFNTKHINFKSIKIILESAWNLGYKVTFKHIEHNIFMCTFKSLKDMEKVK